MSFKEEKIGWAANKRGDIIHVSQANSGANGYFCLGCRKEMMAKKGQIRVHHFSHLALYTGKGGCLLTDEDVRMLVAKDVLQRQKAFTLPPFYTQKKGKSFKVSGSETVKLSDVWIEPRLTLEKRQPKWYRGNAFIKDEPLLSPSALIHCMDGREYVLYLVPRLPDKLSLADIQAAVRFSQIPSIIKVIPPVNSLYEIENIFRSFKQTYWLYYERNSSNHMDSGAVTKGSEEIAEREGYLLPYEETVSCRKFRIKEAVRWLMECVESGDFRAAEGAIGERIREEKGVGSASENVRKEEEGVEEFLGAEVNELIKAERRAIKEVESQLRERDRAALEEAQRRFEEQGNGEESELIEAERRERRVIEELRGEKTRIINEIKSIEPKLQIPLGVGSFFAGDMAGASRELAEIEGRAAEIEKEINRITIEESKLLILSKEAQKRRSNPG